MGIRHLKKIGEFFEENKGKWITKTQIRDELKIDYNTVLDALTYFLNEGKIEEKDNKFKLKG